MEWKLHFTNGYTGYISAHTEYKQTFCYYGGNGCDMLKCF